MKNAHGIRRPILLATLLLTSILSIALPNLVEAFVPPNYTPPNQVTLNMYHLLEGGHNSGSLCVAGDTRLGCTYFEEDTPPSAIPPYPFGSQNPVTIGLESHPANNVQQGYLHNVVPQELDPGRAASSVRAQAIAS
jgi:hypothetical protein